MLSAAVAFAAAVLGLLVGLSLVALDLLPGQDTAGAVPVSSTGSDDACADGDRVALQIAAAPEITPPVRAAVEDAAGRRGLRCVEVSVAAMAPAEVADGLARGWSFERDGPPPDVWIPRASTELALARTTTSVADMAAGDAPSVARSPMVIAMPRPMAAALGWPGSDLTWEGLTALAAVDDAWAQRGHPAWDPFTLSLVTDVAAEPSMSAVTAMTRAVGALPAPADTANASEDQVFEARAQLLLMERRIEYLGSTTAEQLDGLRASDADGALLRTVSALPLTEQAVWAYNGGGGGTDAPSTPLVAWYPPDGGPDADYPFVELDAPWSDGPTAAAAEAVREVLTAGEGQRQLRAAGFRDVSRQATAELRDAAGIRPALAPTEPPAPVPDLVLGPLLESWRGLSQTGNLLAVIDVSGSMGAQVPGTGATRLALSAGGVAAGIALLDPATSAGVWEFSTDLPGGRDHRQLVSLGPLNEDVGGVTRREAAIAAVRALRPRADTGLYDSIAASYAHVLERYEPGALNAVIFFTDGRNDDADGITLEQLRARMRGLVDPQRPVQFVGVAYGAEADFAALSAVTAIAGGALYELERPEDIRNVFIDVQTGGVG